MLARSEMFIILFHPRLRFLEPMSKDIRKTYIGIKGFSVRYLKYMKKFARECDIEKVHTVYALLSGLGGAPPA